MATPGPPAPRRERRRVVGGSGVEAVASMRRSRVRRWRRGPVDVGAFVVGAGILAALFVSAVLERTQQAPLAADAAVSARTATVVAGLVIVALLLAAITSGARGGPLALGSATVLLVLLAPVDRGALLRFSAARHVLVAAVAGASAGAIAWAATAHQIRTGGRLETWAVCGGALGATCAGAALLTAGLRVSGRAAFAARLVVVTWWGVDAAMQTVTSPMSAVADLIVGAPDAASISYGIIPAGAIAAAGVVRVGGLSVEQAWRRTAAADQLRNALALNDVRTGVLLLRRRAHERPRLRPWRRIDGRWPRRHPIAARSLRGLARWPAARVGRFLTLAVFSGALVAAGGQVPVLVGLACVLVYGAAIDASDALAQELDHPDLGRSYPMAEGALCLRHVPVPLALMTGFCAIAGAVAGIASGTTVLPVALMIAPAVALAAMAGATLTASRTARPLVGVRDYGSPPELVVPRIALRVIAPLVPLLVTVLPVAWALPQSSGLAAAALALPGAAVSASMLAWVVLRARLVRLVLR